MGYDFDEVMEKANNLFRSRRFTDLILKCLGEDQEIEDEL